MRADTGIDASIALAAELDRLSVADPLAASAPRDRALYGYLSSGLVHPDASIRAAHLRLVERLIGRLGIWWSPATYATMPTLTPWCIRDRSARYDQGPEAWSAPRADGYLRDDNSIIKKLPLPVRVSAPEGHPYADRRAWRGFTACHVWGPDTDGRPSGADPWLYSFVPNLVWLPTPIAPLTDRQGSVVQRLLMQTARTLYAGQPMHRALSNYADYAWSRLAAPPPGFGFNDGTLATFSPDPGFYRRRRRYISAFIEGAEDVLSNGSLSQRLFSSRYTREFPRLDVSAISDFRDALATYCEALAAGGSD